MALVRILVDGYSLLHNWAELAPGRPRHSAAAREALVFLLTRYQDACGTPVTVVFDGSGAPPHVPKNESRQGQVEVLFSGTGQTADDLIERAAHRFQPYGAILAVTDDNAERDMVIGLGGYAASCDLFIRTVQSELSEFATDLQAYNRREHFRYRNSR